MATTSTPIPHTVFGTSDPVNLCKGIAIFEDPPVPPLELGVNFNGTLVDVDATTLGNGPIVKVGYEIFYGICGPSWAHRSDVSGEFRKNDGMISQVELVLTDDITAAGLVFGASTGLTISVELDALGDATLSIDLDLAFDLVEICSIVLQEALDEGAILQKVDSILPSLSSSWGAYDEISNALVANNGQVAPTPVFTVPLNIWGLIVLLDETTAAFGESVTAADKTLSLSGTSITIGPTFGLGVRINLSLKFVNVPLPPPAPPGSGVDAVITSFSASDSSLSAEADIPFVISDPTALGLEFEWHSDLALTFGFEVNITFLAFASIGGSASMDMFEAFNINVPVGGKKNRHTFSSNLGSALSSADPLEIEFA